MCEACGAALSSERGQRAAPAGPPQVTGGGWHQWVLKVEFLFWACPGAGFGGGSLGQWSLKGFQVLKQAGFVGLKI